jgi:hypothetical protein
VCRGTCRLAGAFRELDTSPANAADPARWTVGTLAPCGGDCDAAAERQCFGYPEPFPPGIGASLDRVVPAGNLRRGTQDWLCFWDFDKSDARVGFDDNACYPIAAVRGGAEGPPYELCIDVRQGQDNGYPHRLRVIDAGLLAAPLAPGEGCSYVLHAASGRRTPACDGAFVRVRAAESGILADDDYVGRFLRFADGLGNPRSASYKILQTLDCAGAPAAPHPCAGSRHDIIVLGSRRGVADAQAAGDGYWIDYGWKPGDEFFVMAPVQVDSATPGGDDTNVDLHGRVDVYGVHFTDLGGYYPYTAVRSHSMITVGGLASARAEILRWRHVIIRNDTGDFATNVGQNLMPDSLRDAVIGHTNILSNTGHGILIESTLGASENLVLEDVLIRHAHDGCFNHSDEGVTPSVVVRRGWCAFIQADAVSAQFFAWQNARPDRTLIEDSGCDACDGGHEGSTVRSNNPETGVGWTVRRTLLWAARGGFVRGVLEDSLVVGLKGSDVFASALLPQVVHRSVVRDVAIHTAKPLARPADYRNDLFEDVLAGRSSSFMNADGPARIENTAWLNFDNLHPNCLTGSTECAVLAEADAETSGVEWRRNVIAWTPGQQTGFVGGQRHRATSALVPPRYDGIAIAGHHFANGVGEAFLGLDAGNVGTLDWGAGPCFFGNERAVNPAALLGMPPTTSLGIPLGFVDPARYRFDAPAGSHADQVGCGVDPAEPAGNRVYGYIHARSGLAPDIMADDADGDGVPEGLPAAVCTGPIGSIACEDNCGGVFNPHQADTDGDGRGNACDPACGLGFELALLLPAIGAWRRRALSGGFVAACARR